MKTKKIRQLSNEELALFCDQFAMTLDAGLNHIDGISIMLKDAASEQGKEILESILESLHCGKKFNEAVKNTGYFPDYCCRMMEIGEISGKLDDVMHSLCDYYTREKTITEYIRSSVKYPFIIIFMMLIVILVLVTKIMPVFEQVFIQLGSQMTGMSKGLMNIGKVISRYSLAFTILLALIVFLFIYFTGTVEGQTKFRSFAGKLFITKGLYEKIAVGRFASSMALTMNAGLRPLESIEMVKQIVENANVEKKIDNCMELLQGGEGFSEALVQSDIFSNLYSRMIAVSGKAGNVDKAMEKIAEKYEEDVNVKINNLISILEPTLVIIFSIIVCLILLSAMMPLMSIMTNIG